VHDAFILAAGLGTRLRPLTECRPKPLVPICGVPLLAYSLAACARHGLTRVVINAHWLADQLVAWEGEREGCVVGVSVEQEILGTGGGLRLVRDQLAERFVVLNADVLHDVDLTALRAAVPEGGGALALRPDPAEAPRYGIVAADATGTVVKLVEVARAEPRGDVALDTHFTGIHALHRDALELVPEGFACIVRTAYKALVPQRRVAGVRYGGPWLDAGDPAAYLEANLDVLEGRVPLSLDPFDRAAFAVRSGRVVGSAPSGVVVEGPAWIGQGARIGRGARLRRAIVGEGAIVPDGAVLEDAVVWDGAEVPAGGVSRAIVHDRGVLAL
jgi:mannose-1-phosphate guanylyltransferase